MDAARLLLLFLALPVATGRLIIGLSLTLSGRYDEVQKANEVKQTLELLIQEANLQSIRGHGFRDFRGNDLFFDLLIQDDKGDPDEVRRVYADMIDRRLADIFLGPQTHTLSDVAARVAWQKQRTIMMYEHHTLPVNAYRPEAGRPGVFSVSLTASDHMLEGLRMAGQLGSRSLATINGRSPMLRSMCRLNFRDVGLPPPLAEEEPLDSYEMLLAMQRIVAREPEVIMTCLSDLETSIAIVAASRVNTSAKVMIMYTADTNAVYNSVNGAVGYLLAPSSWHFTMNHSCRVFGSTTNFVQVYRAQFGIVPSSLDAAAVGAALTVMTGVERTNFEGEDTEKNIRLTDTLRSGQGADTSYGQVQFRFDGTFQRPAVTLQLRAQEFDWTSSIVSETNLSSLVYPLPSWASRLVAGSSSCDQGPGYIVNPTVLNNVSSGIDCRPCPPGETSSANGQYCKVCSTGTFSMSAGSACFPCPLGADCRRQGTSLPPSMPSWYRLDEHVSGWPYFFPCTWNELCLGNNQCSGFNTGIMCSSCVSGYTNAGFFRRNGACSECLPKPLLMVIFIVYIGVVYFIIAKTAQASEQGQIWKRVVAYCQLCSAATKAGFLSTRHPFLELLTDMVLYPFHSILGPDCLFSEVGALSQEAFVVILGVALLPCLFFLTTLFFMVARGIGFHRRKRNRQASGSNDRGKFFKDFISAVARDATRWGVATLYVLYCPSLAIFLGSLSFTSLDVLRLRHFPNVMASSVVNFSIISAVIAALQGFAVPISLYLVLRRLKRRHLLKDEKWQYVFGMLYNDVRPELWYFEIFLFFQKFSFILGTAIPVDLLRIFFLMAVVFMHMLCLLLIRPYSAVDGYILVKLEYCFFLSVSIILVAQILLNWASVQSTLTMWNLMEVVTPLCVFLAHAVFACLAARAFVVCTVYHPLALKAIAMPEAMSRAELFLCKESSLTRMTWDREHQRINFSGFSRRQRKRLYEGIASLLEAYIFTRRAKPIFHASFLCLAVDQAIENCKDGRAKQLQDTHARMLRQQKRGGCTGLMHFWCPMMMSTTVPEAAEGIALAKQKRADRRSLMAALPRVSTPQATIDEMLKVFERQHVKIMKGKETFFQPWDTPIELKYGPGHLEDGTPMSRRASTLQVLNTYGAHFGGNTALFQPKFEQVGTRSSPEQLRQRLPLLRKDVEELRQSAEGLRRDLEEVQEQIARQKAMAADKEVDEELL